MSARGWRSALAVGLGRLRLLHGADRVACWGHAALHLVPNRRFARRHPDFAVPPAVVAFEALGHASAREYHDSGRAHAAVFAAVIRRHVPGDEPSVMEWGCGPGRIVRWMREAGLGPAARLHGVDVDPRCIEWCRKHVRGVEFARCGPLPALPAADGSLDAVYCYSVWTHLSEASIAAWVADFARALRDHGVLVGTSHGDRYADMLLPSEAARYRRGEPVVHAGFAEGRKRYVGFHPPAFMTSVLGRHFRHVERLESPAAGFPQDLWLAQGPRR